jgi:hypothetical protein
VTAQELVEAALRSCSILASGESASTEERADGLVALNHLIDSWSAESLLIPHLVRREITLNGASEYAISGTRPMKIKAAASLSDTPMNGALKVCTAEEWSKFEDRNGASDFGEVLYYEVGLPNGKIHIAPTVSGTLELFYTLTMGEGEFETRKEFTLTGQPNYNIGPGATFDSERPKRVTAAAVEGTSTRGKPCQIVTADDWARYERKGENGSFADVLLYDASLSSPKVYVAPTPASGTLELWVYEPLTVLANLAATVSFAKGYERALKWNLAVELAPEYGRPVTQEMLKNAADSKMAIAGLNRATLGDPASQPREGWVPGSAGKHTDPPMAAPSVTEGSEQ